MMGNGPTAGKPANAKLLIGGFDPVAVDTVAAQLMGFNPDKIPIIKYSCQSNVGQMDYEIIGDGLKSFHLKFDKPAIAKNRIKAVLLDFAGKFYFKNAGNKSRMTVDNEKCNLCLRCREMCPFNAISLIEKKIVINMEKCEFCLCCTEVCKKEAIQLKGMLIGKEAFLK
jgi:ferredoxin